MSEEKEAATESPAMQLLHWAVSVADGHGPEYVQNERWWANVKAIAASYVVARSNSAGRCLRRRGAGRE